ncbi:MAG: hypothetical protein HQK76_07385 [Desulfobacterales bacterium]|nr:hypothetical protein [Desulfobacterales bacterium]
MKLLIFIIIFILILSYLIYLCFKFLKATKISKMGNEELLDALIRHEILAKDIPRGKREIVKKMHDELKEELDRKNIE